MAAALPPMPLNGDFGGSVAPEARATAGSLSLSGARGDDGDGDGGGDGGGDGVEADALLSSSSSSTTGTGESGTDKDKDLKEALRWQQLGIDGIDQAPPSFSGGSRVREKEKKTAAEEEEEGKGNSDDDNDADDGEGGGFRFGDDRYEGRQQRPPPGETSEEISAKTFADDESPSSPPSEGNAGVGTVNTPTTTLPTPVTPPSSAAATASGETRVETPTKASGKTPVETPAKARAVFSDLDLLLPEAPADGGFDRSRLPDDWVEVERFEGYREDDDSGGGGGGYGGDDFEGRLRPQAGGAARFGGGRGRGERGGGRGAGRGLAAAKGRGRGYITGVGVGDGGMGDDAVGNVFDKRVGAGELVGRGRDRSGDSASSSPGSGAQAVAADALESEAPNQQPDFDKLEAVFSSIWDEDGSAAGAVNEDALVGGRVGEKSSLVGEGKYGGDGLFLVDASPDDVVTVAGAGAGAIEDVGIGGGDSGASGAADDPGDSEGEVGRGGGGARVAADIGGLKVPELKARCKELGLPVGGRKAELQERIKKALE